MKFKGIIIITFLFVALAATTSYAQNSTGGGYANLIFGLSVPDAANTTMHTLSGFNGGTRVNDKFSLGGYHANSSTEDGPGNLPFSYSQTGLEARFNMASGEKDIFVSLRAGITKVNTTVASNEVIFSPYHYGIVSGFNFKLWQYFTLGFEGSYMEAEESQTTSGTAEVIFKAFHTINFFVTIGGTF